MLLPPVIERELRVALHKRHPAKSRFWAAVGASGLFVFFWFLSSIGDKSAWKSLHGFLFLAGLAFGVIKPAQACIGLFTEERRNQTLELLALTGMTSTELFLGKLFGGLLVASCDLLAIMPFVALPFLAGGVSLQLFLATAVCLPVLLLFSVSVAVLASVLCTDDGVAAVLSLGLIGLLSLASPVPYALGKTLAGTPPFSPAWLWLSPGYGALLVGKGAGYGTLAEFWPTAGLTLGWAGLCLALAAMALTRSWRHAQDQTEARWPTLWKSWVRGGVAWRAGLRSQLLHHNAFQWLVQRDRRSVVTAWAGAGCIGLLWLAGWRAWPDQWVSTFNGFLTAMLLIMLVDTLELYAAARCLGESRRDGTLELLLTTPLSIEQIVDGQIAALQQQFRLLRWGLLAVCGGLAVSGFYSRAWTVPGVISYLLIWCLFLAWCLPKYRKRALTAMWVAVITGRPAYALFRSQGSPWQWVWLLYNLQHLLSSFGRSAVKFPSGSGGELAVVSLVVSIVLIVAIATHREPDEMRSKLLHELRAIAQTPVPAPDDPRFKEWKNVKEPFPAQA